MPGGDLEALIAGAPGRRLPLEQTLAIADQVCQGLEHAHRHGIVHRDLKPGNVWLTQGTGAEGWGIDADPRSPTPNPQLPPVAKLGDFGLAVALDRSRLTQAGMMVGTVHYMPPEQALGGEVTPPRISTRSGPCSTRWRPAGPPSWEMSPSPSSPST